MSRQSRERIKHSTGPSIAFTSGNHIHRPRHIAFAGTPWVPASPPRTHETVYYGITDVTQTVTQIKVCNMVYITCIQISWRSLGQGSKPNPRFWRGLHIHTFRLIDAMIHAALASLRLSEYAVVDTLGTYMSADEQINGPPRAVYEYSADTPP
jgi:hypothetical protein